MREQREREVPVRLREVGLRARSRRRNAAIASGRSLRRVQREPQIVPRDRVIGLQRERAAIGRDRLVVAVGGRERKPEIVVELGLLRTRVAERSSSGSASSSRLR